MTPLLTTGKACAALGIGRTKLLSLIRDGRLACVMFDGRIRIDAQAIDDFRKTLHDGYTPGKPPIGAPGKRGA